MHFGESTTQPTFLTLTSFHSYYIILVHVFIIMEPYIKETFEVTYIFLEGNTTTMIVSEFDPVNLDENDHFV